MQIKLNGTLTALEAPLLLAELLRKYGITIATGRVAVAFNEKLASRTEWDALWVHEGDRIEIIHAVQGG